METAGSRLCNLNKLPSRLGSSLMQPLMKMVCNLQPNKWMYFDIAVTVSSHRWENDFFSHLTYFVAKRQQKKNV
jgi:ATP-dependent RNA circularization protein (DNA/RNA ligase family)